MLIATATLPGQYTVQLATNGKQTYWYVTYGLADPVVCTNFDAAWEEYVSCCQHAAECAGLLTVNY